MFTTECVLKLGALGADFFRNGWNVFDFVIVLASLVDLGLEIVNGLSVLRGMRLVSTLLFRSCFSLFHLSARVRLARAIPFMSALRAALPPGAKLNGVAFDRVPLLLPLGSIR